MADAPWTASVLIDAPGTVYQTAPVIATGSNLHLLWVDDRYGDYSIRHAASLTGSAWIPATLVASTTQTMQQPDRKPIWP